MFDVDIDESNVGRAPQPRQWVAVAPPVPNKRTRAKGRKAHASSTAGDDSSNKPDTSTSSHAQNAAGRATQGRRKKASEADESAIRSKHEKLDERVTWLQPEEEEGNVEYKLRLRDPSPGRLEQLITQMKYRLSEGSGQCFYYVGVEDRGYPRGLSENDMRLSLNNLCYMAEALEATCELVKLFYGAYERLCAYLCITRNCSTDIASIELRIAVGGSADCGKSSLIAVLTHGVNGVAILDDGAGTARTAVFRHQHEVRTGHTSSISHCMLGYDVAGAVLNYSGVASMTAAEICAASHRLVHFLDLGGLPRYLKTALYGMTSLLPDFLMLCISATVGVSQVTQEHLAAALALDMPIFCALTKVDLVDAATLASRRQQVRDALMHAIDVATMRGRRAAIWGASTDDPVDPAEREPWAEVAGRQGGAAVAGTSPPVGSAAGVEAEAQAWSRRQQLRVPVVLSEAEAKQYAQLMCIIQQHHYPMQCRSYIIPCFEASAVTGKGVDVLHTFLAGLQQAPRRKQPAEVGRNPSMLECFEPWPAAADVPHPLLSGPLGRQAPQTATSHPSSPLGPSSSPMSPSEGTGLGTGFPAVAAEPRAPRLPPGLRPADVPPMHQAVAQGLLHFQVDHVFNVTNRGTVVSGTLVRGRLKVSDTSWWGPSDDAGAFEQVLVTGIHRSQVPVAEVAAGQYATVALEVVATPRPEDDGSRPPDAQSAAPHPQAPAADGADAGERSGRDEGRVPPTAHGSDHPALTATNVASDDADAVRRTHLSVRTPPSPAYPVSPVGSPPGSPGFSALPDSPTCGESRGLSAPLHTRRNLAAQAPRSPSKAGLGARQHITCGSVEAVAAASPSAGNSPLAHNTSLHTLTNPDAVTAESGPVARGSSSSAEKLPHSGPCDPRARARSLDGTVAAAPSAAVPGPVVGALSRAFASGAAQSGASPLAPQAAARDAGAGGCWAEAGTGPSRIESLPVVSQAAAQAEVGEDTFKRLSQSLPRLKIATRTDGGGSGVHRGQSSAHDGGLDMEAQTTELPPGRLRKGSVLLDLQIVPTAAAGFNAFIILTNGQWPARGLHTGCWPPSSFPSRSLSQEPNIGISTDLPSQRSGGYTQHAHGSSPPDTLVSHRSRSRTRQAQCKHILHCGSIRQEVLLEGMQEMQHKLEEEGFEVEGVNLTATVAAAAVLRGGGAAARSTEDTDAEDEGEGADICGALVQATFSFAVKKEWVMPGMRFLVRDRSSGLVSAVGVLREPLYGFL